MVIILLIIVGLCLGSFVNALVWRVHENSKKANSAKKLSIVNGRSICPNCRHKLAPQDLVPVISWIFLKGKCRYCSQKIDDSPLIELLLPVLFVFSYIYWPSVFNHTQVILFCLWLVFLTGFLALALYDLRWFLLPNNIIYPLFILAIIQIIWLTLISGDLNTITTAYWGILIGGGIFYMLFQLSKGKWIGGGDVKLGALCGLLVGGPAASLLLIFIASCLGSLVSLPLILTGKAKRSSRLPFGPFLIIATLIVKLFGGGIVAWYKAHLLLT